MTIVLAGYENTHLFADGLEEFWNYTVTVEARTNVGSPKTSITSPPYRTLPTGDHYVIPKLSLEL